MNKMTIMHRVGAMLMLILFTGISWAQEQKVQSVTLDLKTAIGIALNENPTIKVADVEIEKKDYSKKETIAGLFPRIDGSASYYRTIEKQTKYMESETSDMRSKIKPKKNKIQQRSMTFSSSRMFPGQL